MPRGPGLKAKIEEARDFKDARAILKKITETTKFTERGAQLLVGLHRKMVSLAFERKENPSTEEPWAEPSKHTTADKRFGGLLTRSGKLLQAATHPNVSYKTKDGATQATIAMPGEPRYGEFQEFGTSHVARRTPSVFVNARTKRVETSYGRSNMLPARPFFPFAANDFTSGYAVKGITKSLQVVFDSVEKSFEKKAIALPAAELEGYTSVVSFHVKGGAPSYRHSKNNQPQLAENNPGPNGPKLVRRDVRTKDLKKYRSLKFHEALTKHMAPKVDADTAAQQAADRAERMREDSARQMNRSQQEGKVETAKQVRRRQQRKETAAYREQHAEDIAARLEEVGKDTLSNRLETGPLDRYRKKLRDLESRLAIIGTTEQYKVAVRREIETLRAEFAVEHGLVFRSKDLEGTRLKKLQAQTIRFNQRMARFNERIATARTPEGKTNIRKEMDAYRAAEYREYHGMGGKPEIEPLMDASEANTRKLAIAAEKRTITKEISEEHDYAVGGRPAYDDATVAKKREEELARRNAKYREATAPAREQREKIQGLVKRAFAGKSFLVNAAAIKLFYERIGSRNLSIATTQIKNARIKLAKGTVTAEIADLHEVAFKKAQNRIKQAGGKRRSAALSEAERAKRLVAQGAKEAGVTAPKKTRVRQPKAESGSEAPKGKPGRPAGPAKEPAAPKTPKEPGAAPAPALRPPKPPKDTRTSAQKKADREHQRYLARLEAERAKSHVEPLSPAQEAANVATRAEIKTLSAQRTVLRKAGQIELVDTITTQIKAKEGALHVPKPKAAAPMNVAQKATLAITQRRVRRLDQYATRLTGHIKAARVESQALAQAGKPVGSRIVLDRAVRLSKFKEKLLGRRDLEMQNWANLQEPSIVTTVDLKVTGPATSTVTPANPTPRYGIRHRVTTPKKENP